MKPEEWSAINCPSARIENIPDSLQSQHQIGTNIVIYYAESVFRESNTRYYIYLVIDSESEITNVFT